MRIRKGRRGSWGLGTVSRRRRLRQQLYSTGASFQRAAAIKGPTGPRALGPGPRAQIQLQQLKIQLQQLKI